MMATRTLPHRVKACTSSPRHELRQIPAVPADLHHPALRNSSHVFLDVRAPSPPPQTVKVAFFDGSTSKQVPLILNSTETVQGLMNKLKEQKPDLGDNLHLIYNGKPVEAQQTMAELGVKTGGIFMKFQRCVGG
ncbi:hypothetical protein SRHO_G00253650 [Serrasalmus rhombeus]